MEVAAPQRVAAVAVQIEPRAAGDENPALAAVLVVQPFQEIAPAAVLVQFVEKPVGGGRQLPGDERAAVRGGARRCRN
ncbi:MAG: hypothetical protein ACK6C0_10270 [Betaproteobacteria bacterium]